MKRTALLAALAIATCSTLAAKDYWYVCLGSFKEKGNAEGYVKYLGDRGLDACIYDIIFSKHLIMHRVLLSTPYESYADAFDQRGKLQKQDFIKRLGINDLWVCRLDGISRGSKNPVDSKSSTDYDILDSFMDADSFVDYILSPILGNSVPPNDLITSSWYGGEDSVYEKRFPLQKGYGETDELALLLYTTGFTPLDKFFCKTSIRVELLKDGTPTPFQGFNLDCYNHLQIDFADIDFDGYNDLLIDTDGGGSIGSSWKIYRYNPKDGMYVGTGEEILNPLLFTKQNSIAATHWMGAGSFYHHDLYKWQDGSLVQIGSISVESSGRGGTKETDWTVSYTDMGGRKERKQISKDFSTLSKSDWQPFMRWIESVRERIRESAL